VTTTTVVDDVPVPEASQATGVPKRTIYRWIGSGRLRSRTVDGVQVVSVEAVRALAAARGAAEEPGTAVPRAGTKAGTGTAMAHGAAPTSSDGTVAARVFQAFESGKTPTAVVREMEFAPRLVLDLWKQHEELQNAGEPGRPPVTEQLVVLRQQVEATAAELFQATEGGTLAPQLAQLRRDLESLAHYLHDLPVPPRHRFECACGAHGCVETFVRCSSCGAQTMWGFQPTPAK
jgi:hypothetical protein